MREKSIKETMVTKKTMAKMMGIQSKRLISSGPEEGAGGEGGSVVGGSGGSVVGPSVGGWQTDSPSNKLEGHSNFVANEEYS